MNNFPTTLFFTMTALVTVLIVAWLALRFLAKISKVTQSGDGFVIRAVQPISSKNRLMIISYRHHDYILGISHDNVSLIDKLPTADNLAVESAKTTP